mgnify:CR=1
MIYIHSDGDIVSHEPNFFRAEGLIKGFSFQAEAQPSQVVVNRELVINHAGDEE